MSADTFVRPMGVPGGPYVGDVVGEPVLPDLSHSAEPADEHLAQCIQLVRLVEFIPPECQPFILHAIQERTAAALKAIAERRFTARPGAHMGIVG